MTTQKMPEHEYIERTLSMADPDVIDAATRRIWAEMSENYGRVPMPLVGILNRLRTDSELEVLS